MTLLHDQYMAIVYIMNHDTFGINTLAYRFGTNQEVHGGAPQV